MLVNCAGIGPPGRVVGRDGAPMPLDAFERVIRVNLIGTFNMMRLVAAGALALEPLDGGERGVIISTASVAVPATSSSWFARPRPRPWVRPRVERPHW